MTTYSCHSKAWKQHKAEIRGFLSNRSGCSSTVDDLLQEVFLKALLQGKGFCSLENPRAWLFHVARNLLVDRLRLSKDQVPLPDDFIPEITPDLDPVDLLSHCLPRVLSEMSAEDRDAISLCDIQGLRQEDYAKTLGLTLPAAKSRLRRARLRLRSHLSSACQVKFDEKGKVCCFVQRPPIESGLPE